MESLSNPRKRIHLCCQESDPAKVDDGDGGDDDDEDVPYMDEKIWGRFPEDLIPRVLCHLPISTILRSSLLSKSLKSTISSSFFVNLNSQIAPNSTPPWLLIFLRHPSTSCFAFDPSLHKWLHLSFPFLPSLERPIAAGDGLLCLLSKDPVTLSICNPISKSHLRIPSPLSLFKYFFVVSGLFSDRLSSLFRLILVGSQPVSPMSDRFVLFAEVYCSETRFWLRTRSFPVHAPLSPHRAICSGVLYCLLDHSPTKIVAFDVTDGFWFALEAEIPPSLTAVRLMGRRNKLVMIGGVGSDGITQEIGIWELDELGTGWERIGWISKEVCDFFLRSPTRQFGCIGHGDLIYFTSKKCPLVVMYVISRNCVKFLDPSPELLDPHHHVSCGFCFEPRL